MYEDYIAERIASLREQKNISAREMSLSIGQNSSYINRIENKLTFPSMRSFFYICEYLQISPKDFFDSDISNPSLLNDITEELTKLNEEQLKTISSVIKEFNKK